MAKLSPMMTYYMELKETYKEEILLFRLGDFYEMFFDDAVKASKILELTLTGRDCGLEERAPMCGVPYHAVDNYIAKLVAVGEKVAICEQLSDPKESKGMVERGVTRVITPGTLIDANTLNDKQSNYLAAVVNLHSRCAIAWVDISTGEFNAIELGETMDRQVEDMLSSIAPSEILVPQDNHQQLIALPLFKYQKLVKPTPLPDRYYRYSSSYDALIRQLGVVNMQAFECEDKKAVNTAAGMIVEYLHETQKRSLEHIKDFNLMQAKNFMLLDSNTRRNLEITKNSRDGKSHGTLLWVVNKTKSSMGSRVLHNWLERPLIQEEQINLRLSAVEELLQNNILRDNVQEKLSAMNDLERIVNRMSYNIEKPREYLGLVQSMTTLPHIKKLLEGVKSPLLQKIYQSITIEEQLTQLLVEAIADIAPANFNDGGLIKTGFNAQLDQLREAKRVSSDWIAKLEAEERESTGIKLLKIKYNRVFGYFIEVPNSMKDKVPYRYARKQTLVNAERYITDELKKIEDTVLNSQDRAIELENQLVEQLRKTVLASTQSIQQTCRAVSTLDVLAGFAEIARANDYVKPNINKSITAIDIKGGRHPVVEKFIGRSSYTANDTYIDRQDNRTMIITGPNMAGKSTYMRQVAVIVLMAHLGCFVPAKSADITLTDRIFTRVGASDDLSFGQSTFMVEMLEVATILKNCTDKSLLILDEIGRGTSTCDGLSIAWSVIEYITKTYKTKTVFSTHYHELTELEGRVEGLKNYKVLVGEVGNTLVFSHRITRGGASKSFGIEVAKLAGLPQDVTDRAAVLAVNIEKSTTLQDAQSLILQGGSYDSSKVVQQNFLQNDDGELIELLSAIKIDDMTPMQGLLELDALVRRAKKLKKSK